MNKLFTKVVGISLGLVMALGTGVAVGIGANKDAVPVHAASPASLSLSTKTWTEGTDYVSWSITDGTTSVATMKSSGTNYKNYLGGDDNNRTSSRFYNGGTVTITPASGIAMGEITFTATSTNYANAFKNSTWTNATAAVDSTSVTITPTDGTSAVSVAVTATCGFNAATFAYSVSSSTYNISTAGIVNGTATGATTIAQNASATVTIVPNAGYKLPSDSSSITVTGATITSYNASTGALVISNPTGAVSISVTLPQATQYSISTSLTNLTSSGDTRVYENGIATVTLAVSDSNTYALPATLTSVTNAVDYDYNSSTGVVTINGANGNVVITASAILKPAEDSEEFVFDAASNWTPTGSENGGYTKTVDLITVTYNKTSASNSFYWNPARIYTNMKMDFSSTTGAGGVTTIKSVVFSMYNTNSYYTALTGNVTSNIVGGGSISKTSDTTAHTVTYTMSGTVTSFSLTPSAQTRFYSLEVTYEKDQSEVELQSISATCGSVLVSQTIKPVITFTPSGASNKNVSYEIVEGTSALASVAADGTITGLGAGTARLKITPEDTHASAITIDVTVNALPNIYGVEVGKSYAITGVNSDNYELTSINTASTPNYGVASTYSGSPTNSFPVRVVNGLYARTVALQVTIESETKYLSYDVAANGNSLNYVSEVNRESSWIFAEESSALVIRNVASYTREFCFNGGTTNRFSCYPEVTAAGADYSSPTFVEIAVVKTDKEYVQDFVDLYLHMTDYSDDKGWCKDTEHGYYLTAKGGYNSLIFGNSTREDLFQNDSDFTAAKARYEKWAYYNNDNAPYDGNDTVVSKIDPNRSALLGVIAGFETSNSVAIIIIISLVSLTAIGGYFFLRKRKEQ